MTKIRENIYLAGIDEVKRLPTMDTYINLSDYSFPNSHNYDIEDYGGEAPLRDQTEFLKAFESIIQIIKGKTVIFCNAGQQRSPAMVAAYLIYSEGLSREEAIEDIKSKRTIVFPRHITYNPVLRFLDEEYSKK